MTTTRLILATGNEGKARELRALIPASLQVVTAASLGVALPAETGETFEENARLKAVAVSRRLPGLVLADDSGLVVDALGGAPGVRSARYAGEPQDAAANITLLLANLVDVPDGQRAARFVCSLCLARSGVVLAVADGACEGSVAAVPAGGSGFGYDPIFRLADGRNMAELDHCEKNEISHRGRALRIIIPLILSHAAAQGTSVGVGR